MAIVFSPQRAQYCQLCVNATSQRGNSSDLTSAQSYSKRIKTGPGRPFLQSCERVHVPSLPSTEDLMNLRAEPASFTQPLARGRGFPPPRCNLATNFRRRLEVARFLRNRGSQFLFLGNRATRIGDSIPEESRFTIPISGESCHL